MFTLFFYAAALVALFLSFLHDREKSWAALKKAWSSFYRIVPEFITVILFAGIILAFLSPQLISRLLGESSGFLGMITASLSGAVALLPGFVAFPLAALVRDKGAGLVQVAAFVSALMMVGIITFPMEKRFFGTRIALLRNGLAFLFSVLIALLMGLFLGAAL